MNGLWILPTRNRVDRLKGFFDACRDTGLSTPGLIMVNRDELILPDGSLAPEYAELDAAPDWRLVPIDNPERGACAAWRAAWPYIQTLDWVGVISDDHRPETVGWDRILVDDIKGWNFVASNDGWQAPRRSHGAVVFSVPLVQAWGWLAPPGFRHLYVDDIWEMIGRATGCWQTRMDVMVRHAGGDRYEAADPTTRAVNAPAFYEHDERAFKLWLRDDCDRAVKATLDLMRYRDVPLDEDPDLSDISIQIATPCLDGRYDRAYLKSLINTRDLLLRCGAKFDWAELPFCSEIAMARNKIVAGFLRSPHTHLMMIDSDMGWDARDVARLCAWRRDFVAAAGPKKTFPMSYCFNITEHGQPPRTVELEAGTGLMEVDQVGGAFILLSKAMLERMVAAYPELTYEGDHHRRDVALFDPMILPSGHRVAEDFAFCARWRRLGGKIHLAPQVALQHAGSYTWMGAVADSLKVVEQPIAQAAE